MAARGPRWPWTGVAPRLRAADIAFGNLECSVSDRGAPASSSSPSAARPAACGRCVRYAGLDVVNLANNHVGDYGDAGAAGHGPLRRATRALVGVGAGLDLAGARTPAGRRALGLRVAFVGFSDIGPYDFAAGAGHARHAPRVRREHPPPTSRAARTLGDVVVATFHWGIERDAQPIAAPDRLRAAPRWRAGADAVIGAHPHVLQPIRPAGPHRVVAYSLGNFVWSASSAATASTRACSRCVLDPRGRGRVASARDDRGHAPAAVYSAALLRGVCVHLRSLAVARWGCVDAVARHPAGVRCRLLGPGHDHHRPLDARDLIFEFIAA